MLGDASLMAARSDRLELGAMPASAVATRMAELLGATYADCEDGRGVDCRSRARGMARSAVDCAEHTSSGSFDAGRPGDGHTSCALFCECNVGTDVQVSQMLRRMGTISQRSTPGEVDAFVDSARRTDRADLARCLMIHSRVVCADPEPRCASCPLISFCKTGRSRSTPRHAEATVVDLFGGAGALGLGFAWAGFSIVAAIEIDRDAAQTYRLNHPGVPVLEASVEDVTTERLQAWLPALAAPAAVIAGPPCQGYSAAGSRDADDRRNLLFRHVGRLARRLGARSVVIENVPGLRRVNGVGYTDKITASLRRCGYRTWTQPVALRASDFGVPQNRQRLFFVGVKAGIGLPEPPVPTHVPHDADVVGPSMQRTPSLAERLEDLPPLASGAGSERLRLPDGRVVLNSRTMAHSPRVVAKINAIPAGGGPISYRRLESDVARTLVAGHRALPVHPEQNRTITVREAARIQGFPDDYFFCGPRSVQPLQVANAVPPALSEAVARQLLKSLEAV